MWPKETTFEKFQRVYLRTTEEAIPFCWSHNENYSSQLFNKRLGMLGFVLIKEVIFINVTYSKRLLYLMNLEVEGSIPNIYIALN